MSKQRKYGTTTIMLDDECEWYLWIEDERVLLYRDNVTVDMEFVPGYDFYHGLTRKEQDELLLKLLDHARETYSRKVPDPRTSKLPISFDWYPAKDEPTFK